MSDKNKAILEEANAAIAQGNYEGFLSFCADDMDQTSPKKKLCADRS